MDELKMTKEWVSVTDEEIKEMNYIRDKYGPGSIVVHVYEEDIDGAIDLFRVIEAKLRERNNT